jgi:hypothetical protein
VLVPHRHLTSTNFSLLIAVGVYLVWLYVLPKLGGYQIRQVVDTLSDGAQTLRVVKVPNQEVEEWDRSHSDQGEIAVK